MQKENNSTKYDLDFLEKVFSYLNNYEKLEIALSDIFQFFKQEKHNLQLTVSPSSIVSPHY